MPRAKQWRARVVAAGKMYCRSVDGMGYCCTSSAQPEMLLCDVHAIMQRPTYVPDVRPEAAYMRTQGLSTSPLAVATAEAAMRSIKDVPITPFTGFASGAPSATSNPLASPPPPLKNLGEDIAASRFFKNMSDHYETDKWVQLLDSSVEVPGNQYSKKLASYVVGKLGINSDDATQFTSDDTNIKVLASAGVKLMFLICELLARQALWDKMPYLQYVVAQKYAPGTEDHKRTKRAIIDALSMFTENEPKVFGATYNELFYNATKSLQGYTAKELGNLYPVATVAVDKPSPREIVADILRGMVVRAAGLPDPNPDDPANIASVVVNNLKELDTKFKCAEKHVGTITEACWAWIDRQPVSVDPQPDLAGYVESAKKLLPAFIAVFT